MLLIPVLPEEPLEENRNREVDVDDVNARSLDDAIDQMSVGETDKHPEKRRKALFAAYEERELPSMKYVHVTNVVPLCVIIHE